MGNDFKIGDRVVVVRIAYAYDNIGIPQIGDTGTIRAIEELTLSIEFDKYLSRGHDCDGMCKDYYGYFISPYNVEKIKGILTVKQWKKKKNLK